MTIWDQGTYELHKWEERKVEVTFHGERLRGRYGLFPIGRERRPGEGLDDPPHGSARGSGPPADARADRADDGPARRRLPRDQTRWSFEVKWDGVRAIAYAQPGRLRLESRNLNEITDAYPEVRGLLEDLGMHEAVLDGEIVTFDERGTARASSSSSAGCTSPRPQPSRRLMSSHPVVYAIFDLLYLDGRSLIELPYPERRARLEALGAGRPRPGGCRPAHPGEGERAARGHARAGARGDRGQAA